MRARQRQDCYHTGIMRRLALTLLLLGLFLTVALSALDRTTAQSQTPDDVQVVDPPPQVLEPSIAVTDLDELLGDPRQVEAGPGSDSCQEATDLALSFTSPSDGGATLTNPFTSQGSDPRLSCMWGTPSNERGYRTTWYRFIARDTGKVTVTTRGTDYDTVLAVFGGSCDNLLPLACSDDFRSLQSEVSFMAVRNQTYYIEVADYQAGTTGPTVLEFSAVMDGDPPRWQQVGNIPLGGVSRHAVAQYGPEFYIIGGQSNLQTFPTLVSLNQRYSVATGEWMQLAPIPGPGLSNTTAVQLDGKIYVPGGFNGNTSRYDDTHWVYDIFTDGWSTTTPIPSAILPTGEPFAWAAAAADPSGQSYYLTGGLSSQPALAVDADVLSQTYRFLPDQNLWQLLPPMSTERYAHTAAWVPRLNKGLCVAGGLSTGTDEDDNPVAILLTNAECLNPNTGGGWIPTAPLNFPRYNAGSAISPEGNWYIFGGLDATGAVPETEVYDPVTNSWKLMDSTFSLGGRPDNPARVWPRGGFVGGELYVFGGNDFPERRVISAFEKLPVPGFPVPLFYSIRLPIQVSGGGDNFLNYASPIAENTEVTGNFSESIQFYNPYFFDWLSPGRATIRLSGIPSDSNFSFAVYNSQKQKLAQADQAIYGGEKSVSLTIPTGRYYILVERLFPKDLPDPNDFYHLRLIR